MNMTKEQVEAALAAGLALTNPDSETPIPMKYAAGAVILHQLLMAIGSGQVQLNTADPNKPETPTVPTKKVAKKVAKKAPRKK